MVCMMQVALGISIYPRLHASHVVVCRQYWQLRGQGLIRVTIAIRKRIVSINIIIIEMEELNEAVDISKEKSSVLAKAGQMTLQNSKYSSNNNFEAKKLGRILQQIDNDDEFIKLDNITTTYLPVTNSPTQNAMVHKTAKKQEKKMQNDNTQYENLAHKIKQNSQMVLSSLHKKNERVRASYRSQQDLTGIEDIIGDIQRVMQASLANSNLKSSFKKQTNINHHSIKRNFHSKGISNFNNSHAVNKLQEMLLHYQMDDPQIHSQTIPIVLNDPISQRKVKNQQKLARIKEYNSITQSISNTEPLKQPRIKPQQKKQKLISLSNIQIIQIDWYKLPIFLSPLDKKSEQLLLKMKDYPDGQQYWSAISESLKQEQEYKGYSIFNGQYEAGIAKQKILMSEQQFRQKWAQEWSYDIEQQEHKDLLCEFDFQWYRSLVQVTYHLSLQDILMKDIQYDIQQFRNNLKSITPTTNDKNHGLVPLVQITIQNKLKYIECLLNHFSTNKSNKTNLCELFIVVVPNIGQSQSKEIFQSLKKSLKEMFVGGLYSSDSGGASMGVMITKKQAEQCKVKKWQGGKIQLGQVDLLINQEGGGKRDKIHLTRMKSKNSSISLKVFRVGQQGIDLQVGQQLYFGRRYHILLD